MEVHPPSGHVGSVKDFFVHLAMISIGILIALGLEQSVEAWHHHEIGLQAKENMLAEIRDNKRELDTVRVIVQKNKAALQKSILNIRKMLAHQKLEHSEISVTVNGADLNSVSWSTAAATGALTYMGYAEAKRFTKAYELQKLLQQIQATEFATAGDALTLLSFTTESQPSEDQLKAAEPEMLHCLAELTMWEQLAAQLSDEYSRVLKER